MRHILITTILAGLAGPGLADTCPTPDELAAGMVLRRVAPPIELRYEIGPDGVTETRTMPGPDGAPQERVAHYAHALAVTQQGALAISYDTDLDQLDRINEIGRLEAAATLSRDGAELDRGTETWSFKDLGAIVIGDCRFHVWRVRSELALDGQPAPILNDYFYAPALGVNLRVHSLAADGTPTSGVEFDTIEPLP